MAALTSIMQQTYALAPRMPLEVSSLPLPGDVRIRACFQPTAPLGEVEVQVGLGRGSVGRGQRVGDDPAVHVALALRLAEHLVRYCRDFGEAAALEEPNWEARLMAARAALEPVPVATEEPQPVSAASPARWTQARCSECRWPMQHVYTLHGRQVCTHCYYKLGGR